MTAKTRKAPGKWVLAGIFLACALPGLLLVWWFAIFNEGLPPLAAQLLYMAVPVLTAAFAGVIWRGRLRARPDWATRRPYSRLMAYLLFAAVTFILPFAMPMLGLRAEGYSLAETLPAVVHLAAGSLPRDLPGLILVTAINFVICLIQTDIGLSLGVWIRDRLMRPAADAR